MHTLSSNNHGLDACYWICCLEKYNHRYPSEGCKLQNKLQFCKYFLRVSRLILHDKNCFVALPPEIRKEILLFLKTDVITIHQMRDILSNNLDILKKFI